jgi:hypothetical protein
MTRPRVLSASGTRSMSWRGQVGACAVVYVDGGGLRAGGITAGCGGAVCAVREYDGVIGRANTCGAVPSRCMSMLRARYTSVGTCTRRTQRARHMSHGLWSRGPKSRWRRARVHVRAPTTMCSVGHECTRRRTTAHPLPHGAVAMPPSSLRRHRASQHNAPQPTTARPRGLAHPRLTHRARRRRPDPRLLHRPHATAPPRAPPPLLRHTHTDTVAAHTTPPCRATD